MTYLEVLLTVALVALLAAAAGSDIGVDHTAFRCDTLGAFQSSGKTYKCTEVVDTIPSPQQE